MPYWKDNYHDVPDDEYESNFKYSEPQYSSGGGGSRGRTCKWCFVDRLTWVHRDAGWRLTDALGKPHMCPQWQSGINKWGSEMTNQNTRRTVDIAGVDPLEQDDLLSEGVSKASAEQIQAARDQHGVGAAINDDALVLETGDPKKYWVQSWVFVDDSEDNTPGIDRGAK